MPAPVEEPTEFHLKPGLRTCHGTRTAQERSRCREIDAVIGIDPPEFADPFRIPSG